MMTEMMGFDLAAHVVSVEMKTVQVHVDGADGTFPLQNIGSHTQHLAFG